MSGRRGFVTGGTWCVDRNKIVDFWPSEDGVAEILQADRRGGGSGCNFAVDIRRLDPSVPVETIGLVGDDEDGRFLLAEADAAGIDRRQLHVAPGLVTNYSDAFVSQRTGRRTHIFEAGASAHLTPDHFDFAATTGRILHLGLPGIHRILDARFGEDANGWVTILRRAKRAGLETNMEMVSIDREKLAGIVRPCLPHLNYLVVNDFEIGALSGLATVGDGRTDIAATMKAAAAVIAAGAMSIVVVHFPMGAVIATRDGVEARPSVAVPPEAIVSANGAGDAFASGTLYGLHEGWSARDSVALGAAVAAASLRALSTTDSVVSWQECRNLAESWGWREAPRAELAET